MSRPVTSCAPAAIASFTVRSRRSAAAALITGPHWTSGSSPVPTRSAAIAPASRSVNSPANDSCTKNRLAATQVWPVWRVLAYIAPSMATSRSAPSSTTNGALPPSSIVDLSTRADALASSSRPTRVEPVNEIIRVAGWAIAASNQSPGRLLGTMLTTPAGTPARVISSPR